MTADKHLRRPITLLSTNFRAISSQ